MDQVLNRLASWLLRAVVLVAGLVVFLSLLTAVLLLAALWGLRALWARITGRPVMPWVMGVDPRTAWRAAASRGAWRRQSQATAEPEQPPTPPQTGAAGPLMRPLPGTDEVTDVKPRPPREPKED
ncbi:MAG: hypothetical protein IPJ36_03645 [Simplicispira sp.]|nr:hypothetical protein [Simplicispira sp.]